MTLPHENKITSEKKNSWNYLMNEKITGKIFQNNIQSEL